MAAGWKDRAQAVSAPTEGGGGWRSRATPVGGGAGQQSADSQPFPGYDVGNSLLRGSSVAEQMPGGQMLSDLGSKIGSGISAATMAPFSDKSFGELYDEGQGAMAKADAERQAIDAKSPVTQGVKEIMGQLPMMAMKQETPGAGAAEEMGQFQYPGGAGQAKLDSYRSQLGGTMEGYITPAKQYLINYLKRKFGP